MPAPPPRRKLGACVRTRPEESALISDRFVIIISFSQDTEVAPRSAFSPESLWLEEVMEAAFAKRGMELGVEVDGGEHLGDEVQFRVRLSGDQEDVHLARMIIRSAIGRDGLRHE